MSAKYFVISIAAELSGMHAQTLRTYDRIGLVQPERTAGGGRRYSEKDVDRLIKIQDLSQNEGINLAGIKRIIELEKKIEVLEEKIQILEYENRFASRKGRELVLIPKSTSIVIWQPRNKRKK